MAVTSLERLKAKFSKGRYPTQEDFADLLESFIHKGDGIGIALVAGLAEALNGKLDASAGSAMTRLAQAAAEAARESRLAMESGLARVDRVEKSQDELWAQVEVLLGDKAAETIAAFRELADFLEGLDDEAGLAETLDSLRRLIKDIGEQTVMDGLDFSVTPESVEVVRHGLRLDGEEAADFGHAIELPVACPPTEGSDIVRPHPGNAGIVTADDCKTIEDSRELLERAAGARFVSDVGFSANAERVSYRRDRFRLDGGHVWVDDETGDFQAIPADGLWGFPMATAEKAGAVAAAQVKAWDAARPGAFVDLCRSYGVDYDESTRLFLLNGLTITEAQMRAIVAAGVMTNSDLRARYAYTAIRTHLPQQIHVSAEKGLHTFRGCKNLEAVNASMLIPDTFCFNGCAKLRSVSVYSPNVNNAVYADTWAGCVALETLKVQAVYARSIWLGDSPLISIASLNGIIDKAQAGVAASTFTVHPDVYAKMLGDPETDRENGWTSLPERAAAKNITFTTTQ